MLYVDLRVCLVSSLGATHMQVPGRINCLVYQDGLCSRSRQAKVKW